MKFRRFALATACLLFNVFSYSSVKKNENQTKYHIIVVKKDSILILYASIKKEKELDLCNNHNSVYNAKEIYFNSKSLFKKLPCSTEKIKIFTEYFLNPIDRKKIV